MLIWLPVGFLLGWFIAAELLLRRASQAAAMSLFGKVNDWRDVLASSLGSGDASRNEKIEFVIEDMKVLLGG